MFLLWSCVRYVAMLSVTEGARGQTLVILVNLCHLRPASFKNHHPIRPALSNTQALSLPHLTHCMKVEMNSPQPTNKPRESAVHTTPPMLTQRQRLRAIVDRHADLLDPPTTAEAFARLEAAMDEANQHSSTDSDITGQNDMLDPPNTAERFARIEAAMDSVFSKSVNTTWTQRHRKKSKLRCACRFNPPIRKARRVSAIRLGTMTSFLHWSCSKGTPAAATDPRTRLVVRPSKLKDLLAPVLHTAANMNLNTRTYFEAAWPWMSSQTRPIRAREGSTCDCDRKWDTIP